MFLQNKPIVKTTQFTLMEVTWVEVLLYRALVAWVAWIEVLLLCPEPWWPGQSLTVMSRALVAWAEVLLSWTKVWF